MKLTIGTSVATMMVTKNENQLDLPIDTSECFAININDKVIPVSIVKDNITEVVLKDDSVVRGKFVSDKNGVTIEDEDDTLFTYKSYKSYSSINRNVALVNNKGVVTFVFKTGLINWTPRILVKIDENELRSTLLASITNSYLDLDNLKINLIGEYQPSESPRYRRGMVTMAAQSYTSRAESSSIVDNSEPIGTFTYQLDLDNLVKGKSIVPLLAESKVKYQEYYQASLYQGKQLAQRIIMYQSPDDYPAGEYTFILPSGVQLTTNLSEYQEGQQVKQSIGPSSNVVVSTTVINRTDKQIQYKVDIKVIKECKVIISLPYYDQGSPKITANSKNITPKLYQEDGDNGWMINHPAGSSSMTIIT